MLIESTQHTPSLFPAQQLQSDRRQEIGISALSGNVSIAGTARRYAVSRKFVYQQKLIISEGIKKAFSKKDTTDDEVLFYLPVTKMWLKQFILALVLICKSSFRNSKELVETMLDHHVSIGTIHNIVSEATANADKINAQEDLSAIKHAALDEIFQGKKPILVGCDPETLYCVLLSEAEQRDADTWGYHLLVLEEKGFKPKATIADFAKGLRAGQKEVWPDTPCYADVFHFLRKVQVMVTHLDNRAYKLLGKVYDLEAKMEKAKKKLKGHKFSTKLSLAKAKADKAIALADDARVLGEWIKEILALFGPSLEVRQEQCEFILKHLLILDDKHHDASYRIRPVISALKNSQDELLGFVDRLDAALKHIGQELEVDHKIMRRLYEIYGKPNHDSDKWVSTQQLRNILKDKFRSAQKALRNLLKETHRASSAVENFNSRLRNYFFLRKQVGQKYLDLLRFYLNHKKIERSHAPSRAGKIPAEMLAQKSLPHWLELLGFERFKQAAQTV